MKILHVTSWFQPNMGYQENCLCRVQAALGHEVSILTSDRNAPYLAYKDTMAKVAGPRMIGAGTKIEDNVEVVRLPCTWEWEAHWWIYLKGLWDAIEARKPDIIHAHNFITAPTVQVLFGNRKRRYPLVVDDHNNYFNIQPYSAQKKLLFGAFKHILRPFLIGTVGRALPMSHEVRRYLAQELGVPESLSTLVFLGADAGRFNRNEEAGRALRAELGIPEDAVVIVSAGKITRVKDNHVLIEAMAELVKREPKAWLLMIGNAPDDYRRELERLIEDLNLVSHVSWVDFVKNDRLPAYYSAADIGVWPGDWSATVIEAAACSVPLILPDREYARYSVMNENGLLFERGDVKALAQCLTKLVADGALRREMGARSRTLVEDTLNWDALARQTIEVYEEVIEKRKRA